MTAVAASRQGEQELIVGNLLGSNLFNSLAVPGLIALLGPGLVPAESLRLVGVVIMAVVALAALALMITRGRVARWEGALLLVVFSANVSTSSSTPARSGWVDKPPERPNSAGLMRG